MQQCNNESMKELVLRITTGITLITVIAIGLYGGVLTFIFLFGLIAALCLWEFFGFTLLELSLVKRGFGLVLGLIPYGIATFSLLEFIELLSPTALFLGFLPYFSLFIFELFNTSRYSFQRIAYLLLGTVYIGCPFAILLFIYQKFGVDIVMAMLVLIAVNDSFAYVVGSLIGQNPLFQRISPNKTWEGSIGGAIVTMATTFIFIAYFPQFSQIDWIIISTLIVVFGSLGDLVESMLKRSLKVKDSSNLLPGHGGFLDRFDAFLFCVPFVAAYLMLGN